MGFTVKSTKANAHILTTEGHNQPRAVAVLLNESEAFEADSPRFAVSPVRFGLNVAQREDAPWLIVLRGSQVRLYAARPGVGVGSRGQAETFFELDLALFWTKPTRDISNMRSRLMPYATMGWSNGSSLGLSGTPRGWGVAEILHGDFRQSDYPKVVRLLLLVLRRLDCVPELVKSLVLVRFTDLGDHVTNRESLLAATTREQSHHTSPMMMCGQLVIPVGLGP
jgi:hypothetical protein